MLNIRKQAEYSIQKIVNRYLPPDSFTGESLISRRFDEAWHLGRFRHQVIPGRRNLQPREVTVFDRDILRR
jgi:hypothetical protein